MTDIREYQLIKSNPGDTSLSLEEIIKGKQGRDININIYNISEGKSDLLKEGVNGMSNKEQRVVKGYDDIEKALKRAEDTKEGIWIGSKKMGRWVFATVDRKILVNNGMAREEFHAFDKAINYITEFIFN